MEYLLLDVAIAYVIDLFAGDPYWLPHPVRFIGWLIRRIEGLLRESIEKSLGFENSIPGEGTKVSLDKKENDREGLKREMGSKRKTRERRAGIVLLMSVVFITFMTVFLILKAASLIHTVLFHIVNIYFIYSAVATKCLGDEAKKVHGVLIKGDIKKSRESLSMLVGRETKDLDEKAIIKGVVETTAENTTDGVISPILYAVLGSLFGIGAPLTYAFKAVSTLDSMVGYKNEKYIDLGRASAKADDGANYLPARLSGLIIPISAFLCGMSFKKSFLVMLRDRRNHQSPNCAYSEAAVAGALGVRIGGTNVYFGKTVEKPTIGDPDREIEPGDIIKTVRIMYITSAITVVLCLAAGFALLKFI